MATEEFGYHAFVINKQRLWANAKTFQEGKSFYEFAVSIVCENARPLLCDAKIVIDKHGDRAFKQRLEKHLKQQMTDADGNCLIRKVGMEASHSNNLVQLADMVCGAVARSFNAEKKMRTGTGITCDGRNTGSNFGRKNKSPLTYPQVGNANHKGHSSVSRAIPIPIWSKRNGCAITFTEVRGQRRI